MLKENTVVFVFNKCNLHDQNERGKCNKVIATAITAVKQSALALAYSMTETSGRNLLDVCKRT